MIVIIDAFLAPACRRNMSDKSLFEQYVLGRLTLANRIVMASLTRNRAGAGLVPRELAATTTIRLNP
jgi:N-ethylmaleimide reductase